MKRTAAVVILTCITVGSSPLVVHAQAPSTEAASIDASTLAIATISELGLSPEVLAVSGLTPESAESLLRAVRTEVGAHVTEMRAEAIELSEASRAVLVIERSLRQRRTATDPEASEASLEQSRQRLEAARLASAARLTLVETSVFQTLDEQVRAKIYIARENRRRGVPAKYWLTSRTDAEWTQLRQALSAVADRARSQSPVPSTANETVSRADGLPETTQAVVGLTRLEAIKSTWQRVVTGVGPEL